MNLYARVTPSDCLIAAASEDDYTGSDRYWPDYYLDGFEDEAPRTVFLADVPLTLADELCKQATMDQTFSDGHEAWQAALPYLGDGIV